VTHLQYVEIFSNLSRFDDESTGARILNNS